MGLKSSKKVAVNRYELEIEVPAEEFSEAVEKSYLKQKNKIVIPGFRKGKAPRSFIEKYYGEKVFFEEAINIVYGPALESAAKEAGLELVDDQVKFDVVKLEKGENFIFKVEVTVMPEVSIEGYKSIEIEKKSAPRVTVKDVDQKIKSIQEQNARLVAVEDGKAEKGDVVTINFKGFVDGEAFEGGEAEDVEIEIGKGQFIPGFEDQIIGHKSGEDFEIKVTFPKEYHAQKLAGKEAIFKSKLSKIQKKELPAIDDEFVKDVSEFNTLEEYKKDLKEKLVKENKQNFEHQKENEIMDKFLELVKADIPEALIKNKSLDLARDFEYKLRTQGLSIKDYMKYTGTTAEKLMENFRPEAEKSVKMSLGLAEVSKLEKFEVSDEEIEKEYENLSKVYSMKPEQVKKLVSSENLKNDILVRKSIECIKSNASEK